ncbi:MAG: glutaredoxin family protein [Proteobacteria bacterium]|jgi:predicted thioredoxin/glutaredoxin|nr:glutaredoxin family protein [Pseudomonadota bacterium]
MTQAIIYSRQDCHLCEKLEDELRSVYKDLLDILMVDIDEDINLKKLYGLEIPVLMINNERITLHPVDHDQIKSLIR